MAEIGLDISHEFPTPLTAGKGAGHRQRDHDGCGDACLLYPGQRYLNWDLPDPAGLTIEQIRSHPRRDRRTRARAAG